MVKDEELEKLREMYIHGNAEQRISTILDRLNYIEGGPNRLCNYVMALEALSRTLVLEDMKVEERATIEKAWEIYNKECRMPDHVELLKTLCKHAKISPEKAFKEENWINIQRSLLWRNFLMHEGAYIRGGLSKELIESCEYCFNILKEVVEVRYQGNISVPKGANASLENWRIEESYKVLRGEDYRLDIWDEKYGNKNV